MQNSRVWFITGCSTGFGRELARRVIDRGECLVATARDKARLTDLVAGHEDTVLALDLDVTHDAQIVAAVAAAQERFGRIDVLVNNAGYGYLSSIEEGEDREIRRQFDANVFGLFAMTRAVLPVMRPQRSGHIMNVTSVAGLIGYPGSGYYAASKHAVEGFSDSLMAEVEPFGIKVTCIEPGPFRTDWAGRSMTQTATRIRDYMETVGARLKGTKDRSGKQPGDPVRAADAMIQIAGAADAPRHLVLGTWGTEVVRQRLLERAAILERWTELGNATDFPDA